MPTHHLKATLFRAKGPEQSGFKMDAVTKNRGAAGVLRKVKIYTLVSARNGR